MKIIKESMVIIGNGFWIGIRIVIVVCLFLGLMKECSAQEKDFVPNGYTIDYPHFYYLVDTVKMTVQARCYYHGKHYANVRFGLKNHFENDVELYYGRPFTFPYRKGAIVTISRKNFKRDYKII